MSPREKQQLYHNLAELLRAGLTFPRALEKLKNTVRGEGRKVVAQISMEIANGRTVAEACAAARPTITPMEGAVLTAVERAGSLDRGLEQLSQHFGAVATARGQIQARLAYPAFLLGLGIVLLNLPKLISQGIQGYLKTVGMLGGGILLGLFLFTVIWKMIANAMTFSSSAERFARALPLIGGIHAAFVMSRFCLAYNLQLEAGINTLDALKASAAASRSALVRARVRKILPEVGKGGQVGPLLAEGDAFDPEVTQAIIVGEETGRLDRELHQVSVEQDRKAFARLDALAEWGPRLAYLCIVGYIGYTIVTMYANYLNMALRIGTDL
jgi:type II secretory pathway component PulF